MERFHYNFYPKSEIVDNFLSDEDIFYIEKLFRADSSLSIQIEKYGKTMSGAGGNSLDTVRSHYWYPSFSKEKNSCYYQINNFINSKIQARYGTEIECENWHILNAFLPYHIHSDSYDKIDHNATVLPENYDYAWTFLIPLSNYNTNTIVFNEVSNFSKNPDTWIDKTAAKKIDTITEIERNLYFSHINKDHIPYFSIDKIFPWKKGNLLSMSRHAFHCSDNFPTKNILEKRALIGWSYARYK